MISESYFLKKLELLTEVDVDDNKLEQAINQYAEISMKIDKLKNELKALEKQADPLNDIILDAIEQYDLAEADALKTKEYLVTIKKKGYDRPNYKYKQAFDWLFTRVNKKMQGLINEAMELNKNVTTVKTTVAVQKNESISSFASNLWNKAKRYLSRLVGKFTNTRKSLSADIEKFGRMIGEQ